MPTVHTNGIDLAYETTGRGAPLLLLHGYTGAGADWAHFGRYQLGIGRSLIIPDLRGHGASPNPSGVVTHRQHARDVLALLDALALPRCQAIGLSMGANTLLHVATEAPDRLEAMVLVSATTHYPEAARATIRQHDQGRSQRLDVDGDDLAFTAADLGRIRARTLVVYGDRDPLYPVEIGLAMYRGIPAAQLWVVPGGEHMPVGGEALPTFVAACRGFLRT